MRPLGFSEFIKSGGSAKCLTLRIDGEEAARWKHGESKNFFSLSFPAGPPAGTSDQERGS